MASILYDRRRGLESEGMPALHLKIHETDVRLSLFRGLPYDIVFTLPWRIVMKLTEFIEREGDWLVAHCPELGIASQGRTVQEASANLREAVNLFLEYADEDEIKSRMTGEVYVSQFEAAYA